jgi:predicted nuclease of predicted toxin-antitoxin system
VLEHLAFLVDENLSPSLAQIARARGFHAMHATWAGLGGLKDHQVASHASKNNMILVTNDLVDFRKIMKRRKLHPGVIFLAVADRNVMDRDAQQFMFEAALDSVAKDEPINEAVHVELEKDADGNWLVTTARYTLAKK